MRPAGSGRRLRDRPSRSPEEREGDANPAPKRLRGFSFAGSMETRTPLSGSSLHGPERRWRVTWNARRLNKPLGADLLHSPVRAIGHLNDRFVFGHFDQVNPIDCAIRIGANTAVQCFSASRGIHKVQLYLMPSSPTMRLSAPGADHLATAPTRAHHGPPRHRPR
jgi:hypothetical protein